MRRPDISAKEWQLREALATVDIKRSEYYPTFNLTGALGTSSASLLALLHNPVSSVGANLTLPFLEWRQRDIEVKLPVTITNSECWSLNSYFIRQ